MRRALIIVGIFSFLFGGCDRRKNGQSGVPPSGIQPNAHARQILTAPPEVTSESEEGFNDLVFYIQEHEKQADGAQTIRVSGLHKGRRIGLEIILGANWQSGSLGKDIPLVTYRGDLSYRAIGPESTIFLQVLDELYGTKLNPKAMATETRFTAITLTGDPRDLSEGPVHLKLFFSPDREGDYAEFYTNIDLQTRRLEIREKDPGYRSQIVRAMRAQ